MHTPHGLACSSVAMSPWAAAVINDLLGHQIEPHYYSWLFDSMVSRACNVPDLQISTQQLLQLVTFFCHALLLPSPPGLCLYPMPHVRPSSLLSEQQPQQLQQGALIQGLPMILRLMHCCLRTWLVVPAVMTLLLLPLRAWWSCWAVLLSG